MATNKILVVEDEAPIREMIVFHLSRAGYETLEAADCRTARELLADERPDLALVDWMLPDMSGLELTRQLKRDKDNDDIAIIMLTARGEIADRVMGLELGADDYMAKPFEPRELVARIETIMRRSQQSRTGKVLVYDGLRLEPETRRVELDGDPVELTTMEFELLQDLMLSRGRVMSRDRLIEKLRGYDADVFDRSIDMLVSRLREKLHDDPRNPRFIRTVRRSGYQFVGALEK